MVAVDIAIIGVNVIYNSLVTASVNITSGVANVAVYVLGLTGESASLVVAINIASVVKYVSGSDSVSAAGNVTQVVALVVKLVLDFTDESATQDVTGRVAIVIELVLGFTNIGTREVVAVGVAIRREGVGNLSHVRATENVTGCIACVGESVLDHADVVTALCVTVGVAKVEEYVGSYSDISALATIAIALVIIVVRSLAYVVASVEITGRVTVIAVYVADNGLANESATVYVTLGIAKRRVDVTYSTGEFATRIVALDITVVRIGVNTLSYVTTAGSVAGGITAVYCGVEYVRNGSFVSASLNVTYGVAYRAVLVLGLAGESATRDVTGGIAIVIELVGGFTGESASQDVTGGIAVVIKLVSDLTGESAALDVTGGIASVIEFVLGCSGITALIAIGVAITDEYVNALPNGNEINRFRNSSIEIPVASVGKSPTKELVSAPCGSLRLCYGAADLNVDVRNIITVCRVK